MRLLIHGLNYAPELVGIAKYTTELAEWMAARGHEVCVVTAPPYYPQWRVPEAYRGGRRRRETINGVTVRRSRIFVPSVPTGGKRILHHMSWGLSSFVEMMRAGFAFHPDVVLSVAPSLLGCPTARIAAALSGARSWVHIQDFEVEAAVAANILKPGLLTSLGLWTEGQIIRSFDQISSISPEMVRSVERRGVSPDRVFELVNWVDTDAIRPLPRDSNTYRQAWGVGPDDIVCLYSGTISYKQSLDTVVDAARQLAGNPRIRFVICGEGPLKTKLMDMAGDVPSILFETLQPHERMADLLSAADIHLLPQIAEATDLVLPSKLAPMLASGRPVVATVDPDTGIAREVDDCGVIVPPHDSRALADALVRLSHVDTLRDHLGARARVRAVDRWSKETVLRGLEAVLDEAPVASTVPSLDMPG